MNIALLKTKSVTALKHQLTPVIGFGLIAGVAAGLLATKNQNGMEQSPVMSEAVMSQLNELQSHIISLESTAQKPLPEIDLSVVEQKLKELSQEVAEIRQFNPDDLNNRIEHRLDQTEQSLSQQLNTLNSTVSEIKSAHHQVKYVPLKALPFSVLSIDSIQNVPVASIRYDYKTVPLEQGDLLAGWKVARVDFRHQEIEFENKNKERVRIKQDNIG